jgi:hypothetical protein
MRQDDNPRSSGAPFSDAGVGGGFASTSVSDFDYHIYSFQCLGKLFFGLGNVTRIPGYRRALVT